MAKLGELKAFVVGWTGACGEELVKQLANRGTFKEVVLLGRRKVEFAEDDARSKLKQEVVDFEDLSKSSDLFSGCDVGYCGLGTTRSESGASGFVKVDYDYTIAVAKLSKEQGCKQFHLISSVGADQKSLVLYRQIKGKVEDEITQLGFDQLMIYRPGLLLRGQKSRGVEKFFGAIMKPVTFFKPEAGQVSSEVVAKCMIKKSECFGVEGTEKVTLMTNANIHQIARELAD